MKKKLGSNGVKKEEKRREAKEFAVEERVTSSLIFQLPPSLRPTNGVILTDHRLLDVSLMILTRPSDRRSSCLLIAFPSSSSFSSTPRSSR